MHESNAVGLQTVQAGEILELQSRLSDTQLTHAHAMRQAQADLAEVREELELSLRRAGEQEAGRRELEGQLRSRAADLEQQRESLAARVDRLLESLSASQRRVTALEEAVSARDRFQDGSSRHQVAQGAAGGAGGRSGSATSRTPSRLRGGMSRALSPEDRTADRQVIEDVKKHAKMQVDRVVESLRIERTKAEQLEDALRKAELRGQA